ncbi:hypothetical protein GZH49_24485 [Nocardia terpenica]|uniref:hypothetical protein n=1 Tax=Nocardia terpenica TaxID=455432 RepID=UPI002FDFB5C8
MSGVDDVSRWESALAGLDVLPRQRVSVYGSWLWWRLGRARRRGLSRRELVGLLRTGMCAQSVLSLLHCRGVSPVGGPPGRRWPPSSRAAIRPCSATC